MSVSTLISKVVSPEHEHLSNRRTVEVWGLPLASLTMRQVLDEVDRMIENGQPHFLVTANLNYAMLSRDHPKLRQVNAEASIVVADGMPLVWASRFLGQPLPERVAGSDLLPAVCELAAKKGYKVFFLGGAEGVASQAVENLCRRFPQLDVVGIVVPPFRELTDRENDELIASVQAAQPEILFLAASQPRGEIWLKDNYRALGVPAAFQIGASIDFAAGRVRRAPRWVGRLGMEWAYRLAMEPKRLARRYWRNAVFLARVIICPWGLQNNGGK